MPSQTEPPADDAAVAPTAPAKPPTPRHIRGYVESYEQGRTCSDPSCETTLSRYNKSAVCWAHDPSAPADRRGSW